MAMTQGTVTVSSNGTVTKSGYAGILYDAFIARYVADGNTVPNNETGTAIKKAFASMAAPIASIVGYVQDNAAVNVPANSLDSGIPSVDRKLEIV